MTTPAKFRRSIGDWIEQTQIDANDALRKIGLDLYMGVLLRTRVDTGRLRGSWRIGINSPDLSNLETGSQSSSGHPSTAGVVAAGGEQAAALSQLADAKLGDTLHITNSLPYAAVINAKDNIIDETLDDLLRNLDAALESVRSA